MKKFKLFGKTYEIRAANVKPLPSVSDDSAWQMYLAGQGYTISAEGALQVAAVFRCVDLISKTMAALPLHMYKNTGEGKQKARDHPLYKLLYVLPNRTTTAYELMQMLVANMLLTRGGYLRIVRDRYGFVRHLKNLPTSCCSEVYTNRENGEQYIYVTYDGITETLREGDFVFIPGFRFGDRTPEDPMTIAASVLGLNNSMTQYAQRGFSGTSPGGYITYPGQLSDTAYERFKKDFQSNYGGAENAGKWMFLENGSTAQPWDRDMSKTQLLDSRKWAVTEICRIFGVPPHMCMDLEKATFSNIEQQSAEFVRDCINPLSVRIEQALFRDLLNEAEQAKYYFKFNTNSLLRGDTATRTSYYNTMRQNGVMNADDIRELEDMNPVPDGLGRIYFINGNMLPLENAKLNAPKSAQAKGAPLKNE